MFAQGFINFCEASRESGYSYREYLCYFMLLMDFGQKPSIVVQFDTQLLFTENRKESISKRENLSGHR